MTITVVPDPPMLAHDFFESHQKVGITSGDVFEGDNLIAGYRAAAYLDSKAPLDMVVYFHDKAGTVIGARCAVGQFGNFYGADPRELPWEDEGVKPEDIGCYANAQRAWRLVPIIADNDETVWEYLETGTVSYAENDISKTGSYGFEGLDVWLKILVCALQIFALEPDELDKYLPDPFPETVFHTTLGDFGSTSPLESVFFILNADLRGGTIWNEWIGHNELTDADIEQLFRVLVNLSTDLSYNYKIDDDRKFRDMLINDENAAFTKNYRQCQAAALAILKRMGWDHVRHPVFSAVELFNENSYGGYGYNLSQTAEGQ